MLAQLAQVLQPPDTESQDILRFVLTPRLTLQRKQCDGTVIARDQYPETRRGVEGAHHVSGQGRHVPTRSGPFGPTKHQTNDRWDQPRKILSHSHTERLAAIPLFFWASACLLISYTIKVSMSKAATVPWIVLKIATPRKRGRHSKSRGSRLGCVRRY